MNLTIFKPPIIQSIFIFCYLVFYLYLYYHSKNGMLSLMLGGTNMLRLLELKVK